LHVIGALPPNFQHRYHNDDVSGLWRLSGRILPADLAEH